MQRFAIKEITGNLLLMAILLLLAPGTGRAAAGCDSVGNCYVRAGATGSGKGADWTNAYTALPATLTRGVTYYIAGGTYPRYTANTADSGSTLITIKAATVADHGTATGWSNSYATDASGSGSNQAIFTNELMFTTDYWTVDGNQSYAGMGCGNTDGTGGYGGGGAGCNFKIDGSACPSADCHQLGLCEATAYAFPSCPTHLTVKYLEIYGAGGPNVNVHWDNNVHQDTDGWASSNLGGGPYSLSHLYIYHSSGVPFFFEFANGVTVDHCFIIGNASSSLNHGTGLADQGSDNVTISNNAWESIEGSDFVEVLDRGGCSGGQNPNPCQADNWQIYGNLFWYDSGNHLSCQTSPCNKGVGDGVIACINGLICTNWKIYQNVIVNMIGYNAALCEDCTHEGNVASTWTVENNLWWNNTDSNFGGVAMGAGYEKCSTCTVTEDYNSILGYNAGTLDTGFFTGAHDVLLVATPSTPFAAWTASPANFHLIGENAYWNAGLALSSPYNVDPDGVTRGADGYWDRGAFQKPSAPPNPPTALTAAPH